MDFYSDFAPQYERVFPLRPPTLEFLSARLPKRGRVLDLGCGPGHYAGALTGRGLEMVGVDLEESMINAARERYPGALFVESDLATTAAVVDRADGAYCIGNVLPHIPPARLGEFLQNLVGILPSGAVWIVQTVNFDRLLPLQAPHDFPDLDAGGGFVFRRRYEPGADGSMRFVTSLMRGETVEFTGDSTLWPLTNSELTAAHAQVGFELVEQHGGFKGEGYDAETSGGLVHVYERGS